ncbi:unnamed protein product [Symbiodinium natans]|uniref:Uncharacterized protein n=1 Tax=Symbiodinium natans TaxID=878477 RepID=A0A812S207_9DINO|nr:unnamed protein product [Symbiodinium natans]
MARRNDSQQDTWTWTEQDWSGWSEKGWPRWSETEWSQWSQEEWSQGSAWQPADWKNDEEEVETSRSSRAQMPTGSNSIPKARPKASMPKASPKARASKMPPKASKPKASTVKKQRSNRGNAQDQREYSRWKEDHRELQVLRYEKQQWEAKLQEAEGAQWTAEIEAEWWENQTQMALCRNDSLLNDLKEAQSLNKTAHASCDELKKKHEGEVSSLKREHKGRIEDFGRKLCKREDRCRSLQDDKDNLESRITILEVQHGEEKAGIGTNPLWVTATVVALAAGPAEDQNS